MDLNELAEDLRDLIQDNLDPIDIEEHYSHWAFAKYRHTVICGRWVNDDPAWTLKTLDPASYKREIEEYKKLLVKQEAAVNIDGKLYKIVDVKGLSSGHYPYCV